MDRRTDRDTFFGACGWKIGQTDGWTDRIDYNVDLLSQGIFLLDNLYTQCIGCEGLSYYQLMFGLFRQAFRPYLRYETCF